MTTPVSSDGNAARRSPFCSVDNAASPILSIGQGPGNTFFAGVENGTVWECPTNVAGDCTTLETAPWGVEAVAYANGKLFVAENASGRISALTINGDKASVTVLKEGLDTPTGIQPAGDTIWITERGAGKIWSLPMPK